MSHNDHLTTFIPFQKKAAMEKLPLLLYDELIIKTKTKGLQHLL